MHTNILKHVAYTEAYNNFKISVVVPLVISFCVVATLNCPPIIILKYSVFKVITERYRKTLIIKTTCPLNM